MPIKSEALSTRPTLPTLPTLTKRFTTSTTTSFQQTASTSNTDSTVQSSITPSGNISSSDKSILGDPSIDGAYTYITAILVFNLAFLVCFLIFATITCRAIKTKKKNDLRTAVEPFRTGSITSPTALELKQFSHRRNSQRKHTDSFPEDDHDSIDSITSLDHESISSKTTLSRTPTIIPRATKQKKRTPSQVIRCHPKRPTQGSYNGNNDGISNMYVHESQSPSPGASRPGSLHDRTVSSPPPDENQTVSSRSYSNVKKTHDQVNQIGRDLTHDFVVSTPRFNNPTKIFRSENRERRYQV